MPLVVHPLDILEFVGRIEREPDFCFARYGDGTFFSLWGLIGVNCDRAPIHGDQAPLLEQSIRDTSITHGIGDLAVSEARAGEWLEEKGITIPWYDCNVMHTASVQGKLNPFIRLLRKRRILLLGPTHLGHMRNLPVQRFVPVHSTRAFYEVDRLEKVSRTVISRYNINMVLISAGTAAPVLVSRLHKHFPEINIIDTGSLWDVYSGKPSRKVFKNMSYKKIRSLTAENFK